MTTKLILIRHGITAWNRQKRYCGSKDIALSLQGQKQAKQLGAALAGIRFDAIYCSSKKRAIQTAKIVFPEKIFKTTGKLREMNFGILEGSTYQQIMKKYPHVYKKWIEDPFLNNIPKGETLKTFETRVTGFIKKILKTHAGKTIALVCHGGTIAIFLAHISKHKDFWSWIPKPASATLVEYKNDKFHIRLPFKHKKLAQNPFNT